MPVVVFNPNKSLGRSRDEASRLHLLLYPGGGGVSYRLPTTISYRNLPLSTLWTGCQYGILSVPEIMLLCMFALHPGQDSVCKCSE